MGSGHYTSCVKRQGKWYSFDDSRVYSISEEDIFSPNAYLLFYARSDVAAKELSLRDVFPDGELRETAVDPESVKTRPWASSPGAQPPESKLSSILPMMPTSGNGYCLIS
mmetsp:Transcript_45887/g.82754  ORF Transcript_45887/g.82754 Transcript_45887/m.82754 type:complete len:110 (+) Transcript_45887:1-330(+)